MGTDYAECVTYSPAVLKTMKDAGCSFKWQGKRITLPALNAELETIRKPTRTTKRK